ncbi:MAG: FtsX-like permease family protein, partial [bacterium]|nr:FtsX-like permease family protein [bacterium]
MKDKNRKQPKIANWILSRVSDPAEKNSIIGDFAEIYFEIAENNGILKAKLWFWQHILLSLPSFIRSLIYGSGAMFKNYFKIALRNITNNKTYSFLNLSGLSLGLVSVILIFLYVQYELSFDSYHENYDRIYRIVRDLPSGHAHAGKTITTYSVAPLGQALVDEYPDVESSIRIFDEDEILVSYNNNNFIEHNVIFTDTEIFRMFSFSLLQGDPATALDDPYSVVLSEKMAEKYFGNDDPMGKILNFNYNKVKDFRVTGILKNIPDNSHFEIDFLIPFKTFGILIDADLSGWRRNLSITYIKLSENADSEIIESNLHGLIETQIGNDPEAAGRKFTRHFLQPLSKIHLYSDVDAEIGSNNDIMVLYIFSSVAILIILIACINYMNLSTSRSIQRSKEVGMRKVVGATRKQLIIQFYFESGILTIFALVISLIAVYAVLPGFNSYIERELDPVHLMNSQTLIWISLITFVVIVISGSYPALFLSSFQPINALKSRLTGISQRISLRNILVVFQFTISILLIICNITINGQLDFINMMDVGYEKEQVLSIEIRGDELRKNLEAVKTELKRNPDVLAVCSSTYLPSRILDQTGMNWPGKINKQFIETYTGEIDYDFIDLYGI